MFPHQKLDWTLSKQEKRLNNERDNDHLRREFALSCISKARFHGGGEVWFHRALQQTRRLLHDNPADAQALALSGLALMGVDRSPAAMRALQDAIRLDKDSALARYGLAWVLAREGHLADAIQQAEFACRLAPESWEAHALLAGLLRDPGLGASSERRQERTRYHVVRAMELEPSEEMLPDLLDQLASSSLETGRLDAAMRLYKRLENYEGWRHHARVQLGVVAYKLEKYKKSLYFLRQALNDERSMKDRPDVWVHLGRTLLQLGEPAKAREACNQALALDPQHEHARWLLGAAQLDEGLYDDAVRTLRRLLSDAPGHLGAFTALVHIRSEAGDLTWLQQALRAEVSVFDRLPSGTMRQPDGTSVSPRNATADRVRVLTRALRDLDPHAAGTLLQAMDLTTDESLRFDLWSAALRQMEARQASIAEDALRHPGRHFGAELGRDLLCVAHRVDPQALTEGLLLTEDDLKRAAVSRHGHATDVGTHRQHIERERQEARSWQALLLLAIATHPGRETRNLLVRWASEADEDLATAARAGLVMMGDQDASNQLHDAAAKRGAEHLVDALRESAHPVEPHFHPRAMVGDEAGTCDACGRSAGVVDHILQGANGKVCSECMHDIAVHRAEKAVHAPDATCSLCGSLRLETRGMYTHKDLMVCSDCIDQSLGLPEREAVARFLAAL